MVTKGQKINDRYEIIKSIGEGGMANVYLAYDTILDNFHFQKEIGTTFHLQQIQVNGMNGIPHHGKANNL